MIQPQKRTKLVVTNKAVTRPDCHNGPSNQIAVSNGSN